MSRAALLVCPAASANVAVDVAKRLTGPRFDLMTWGGEPDLGPHAAALRRLEPPPAGVGAAARWLASVRRRRYRVVVVAQPSIMKSRARGVLRALPLIAGSPQGIAVDLHSPESPRPIARRRAALDLLAWIAFTLATPLLVRVAARAVEAVGERAQQAPSPAAGGSVVYLRTDIHLAGTPIQAGGSLAHTNGVLSALLHRGHDVELWSTMPLTGTPPAVTRRQLPNLHRANVSTELLELASGLLQGLDVRAKRPRDLRLVYQRYSLNNLAGLLLARRWRVPLILEVNASEVNWRRKYGYLSHERLAAACERLLVAHADQVVTVSENAARDLVAAGADRRRLRVIPNGVEIGRFTSAAPHPLPFDADAFVVCFVGLFYPWHGVRCLAEAFALVHERCPRARLVLVGDGVDAPAVRSIIDSHRLADLSHLPGMVPHHEAPRYMAAADVLVSPHADVPGFIGSPVKLYEYMAAGRAIVASRVGQLGDVLRDGENGLVVTPGSVRELADALLRLAGDEPLRNRLAAAALEDARRLHSWDARLAAMLGAEASSDGAAPAGRVAAQGER